MKRLKSIPDNSNGLVLKPRELVVTVAVVLVLTLAVLPICWRKYRQAEIPRSFRLAEELRDDYYGYRLVAEAACRKYPAVFIGDSVVWGKYVDNDHTLPELVNRALGKEELVNLAVDGLHPVAMERLLRDHGDGIRGKRVYLYWNPLWMNTPLYDLSGEGEFSINHPRLLPQFDRSYRSYRANFGDRVSAFLEQRVLFAAWMRHFRAAYCANRDVKKVIASGDKLAHYDPAERRPLANSTVTWEQNGIKKQDWPWVDAAKSRQYAAFRRVLALLRKRGNQVTVVLGTVNPHMQTPGSLERYHKLRAGVKADLEKAGVAVIDLPELASKEYADASHPLAAGYRKLAEVMVGQLADGGRTPLRAPRPGCGKMKNVKRNAASGGYDKGKATS